MPGDNPLTKPRARFSCAGFWCTPFLEVCMSEENSAPAEVTEPKSTTQEGAEAPPAR